MKKYVVAICAVLSMATSHAQYTRNVLIENFTGTWCGYCPNGHDTINQLQNLYPGRINNVGMHFDDEFQIPYMVSMVNKFNVSSYPAATIDRYFHSGTNSFALNYYFWHTVVVDRLNITSPVELSINASYDWSSKKLNATVNYTFGSDINYETRLSCVLLEDSILAPQSGSGQSNYVHMDVVRAKLHSDDWGDVNNPSTVLANSQFSKTFSFDVPDTLNPKNLRVVAWINKMIGFIPQLSIGTEVLNSANAKVDVLPTAIHPIISNVSAQKVWPNPFTSVIFFDFNLQRSAHVKAFITDITGQIIQSLSDDIRATGKHSIAWGGYNQSRQKVPAGIYFFNIQIDDHLISEKVILQ